MKIKYRHILFLITFCLSALMPSAVFGAGLAAIKEKTSDDDAAAKIVVYSTIKTEGQVLKITSGDKTSMMDKNKLAGKVEVISTLPANTPSADDLKQIQNTVVEYRKFAERFPKSSASLNPHITALDTFIKEAAGDKVRYNGKWLLKEEALVMKQKDEQNKKAELDESTRELREKMAFDEEQKAKGLAKYNGKWLPANEVKLLVEKDEASLTQAANAAAAQAADQAAEKKFITENVVRLQGSINQVTNEGMLVYAHFGNESRPNFDSGKDRPALVKGDFFLVGHPDQKVKVDDSWFDVDAVPDGVFEYTTVVNASRRVAKYRVIKSYY